MGLIKRRGAYSRNLLTVAGLLIILTITIIGGNYLVSSRITSQKTVSEFQSSLSVQTSFNIQNSSSQNSQTQQCAASPDKVIDEITVGSNIGAIAYDSAKDDFYVVNNNFYGLETNSSYNDVYLIDGSTNRPSNMEIPVGSEPADIAYDPDNGNLYVANYGSNSVSVINGSTNTVTGNISVGSGPMRIAYDPYNKDVYVSDARSGFVSVIDTASEIVSATVSVDGTPTTLQYDALNHEMYVADSVSGTLTAINSTSNAVAAVIVAGQGPTSMAYLPDTTNLYYATQFGAFVINSSTNEIVANLTSLDDVNALGYDQANGQVYVAGNASTGFLYLLRGSNGSVSYQISGYPWIPIDMAYNPSNGEMYVTSNPNTVFVLSSGLSGNNTLCTSTTTATTSEFTPQQLPLSSLSPINSNGLQLSLSTNETKIIAGQTIIFNLTVFNTLASTISVNGTSSFAYPWLTYNAPCTFPYDAMVLGGILYPL